MSRVIAVLGKGGVGKTTVSALILKALADSGRLRVLAIDADPSGGLGLALSMPVPKTVNDVRLGILESIKEGGAKKTDMAASLDYRLWEALSEHKNIAFLSVGRPEEEGCYCQLNTLLREAIETLSDGFDKTVIDAEAGIEQVNRRVMRSVDTLVLVSDTTLKGIRVVASIEKVAKDAVDYSDIVFLLNRVRSQSELDSLRDRSELKVSGWIPEDETVRHFDSQGWSFLDLPPCEAYEALKRMMVELALNGKSS